MSTFYLSMLIVAVAAGVVVMALLPFVYLKGRRDLDRINWRLDVGDAAAESASNVRAIPRWELARRREIRRRQDGAR